MLCCYRLCGDIDVSFVCADDGEESLYLSQGCLSNITEFKKYCNAGDTLFPDDLIFVLCNELEPVNEHGSGIVSIIDTIYTVFPKEFVPVYDCEQSS